MREGPLTLQSRFGAVLSVGIEDADGWTFAQRALQASGGSVLAASARTMLAGFAEPEAAFACALRMGAAASSCQAAIAQGEVATDRPPMTWPVVALVETLRLAAPAGHIAMPEPLFRRLQPRLVATAITLTESIMEHPAVVVPFETDHPSPASDRRITLGVVPFRPAGAAAALADQTCDEVIRLLGSLPDWLSVTRAPSIVTWRAADLRRIRRACPARYLLHGIAEEEGSLLRLTLELTEAETGRVLWSDRFDQPLATDGSARERCAARIACSVLPLLVRGELERSSATAPQRLEGQDVALQAMAAVFQPQRTSFAQALESLRMVEARPDVRESCTAVGIGTVAWHLMAVSQGWTDDPDHELALAEAAAKQLAPGNPMAAVMLGYLESVRHGNHALACALLDHALEQTPACPMAWTLKARVLVRMDRIEAAVSVAERAGRLPSLGIDRAWRAASMALTFYAAERHQDAAHWAKVSATYHPNLAMSARVLSASLAALGRLEEADRAAAQVLRIDPGFRLSTWRMRSPLPVRVRDRYSQRLRLAGLPE